MSTFTELDSFSVNNAWDLCVIGNDIYMSKVVITVVPTKFYIYSKAGVLKQTVSIGTHDASNVYGITTDGHKLYMSFNKIGETKKVYQCNKDGSGLLELFDVGGSYDIRALGFNGKHLLIAKFDGTCMITDFSGNVIQSTAAMGNMGICHTTKEIMMSQYVTAKPPTNKVYIAHPDLTTTKEIIDPAPTSYPAGWDKEAMKINRTKNFWQCFFDLSAGKIHQYMFHTT